MTRDPEAGEDVGDLAGLLVIRAVDEPEVLVERLQHLLGFCRPILGE